MADKQETGFDVTKIVLVAALCFAGYQFYQSKIATPVVNNDTTTLTEAQQVPGSLVLYSASAYKETLAGLSPTDTEATFNAKLSKAQKAATDMAYKPLDTMLAAKFDTEWTPDKARVVYSQVQADLEKLLPILDKAGLIRAP